MSGGERAIRSVCVAGAGIVGLSAALAFARALPNVAVTIVETPADPAALADRLPGSLPSIHRFHAAIGLDELALVREGIATHLLGTRFEAWSARGEPWYHVFGEHGLKAGDAPFHAVWQRARAAGRAAPFHAYAAAAALAAAGKFAHPGHDPDTPLGTYLYALRLDPERYRVRLAAQAAGLKRECGPIAGVVRREDGGVAALLLADDRRVAADLFLDCTGPSAALLSEVEPAFESWAAWLPCDRIVIGEAPAETPTPCDLVRAEADGWHWRSPLLDRTLTGRAFCAGADAPSEAVTILPGRRPAPWVRNVLALGDAAVAVDPLHCTGLHLAQSAMLRALELLPGRDMHPLELREYNRRTAQETERVRDFLALHYLRAGRGDWARLAEVEPPPGLARTLEQFERRGRLPFFEEESFDDESWRGALSGLGIMPRGVNPLALGVDLDRASAGMEALAARLAALPDRFPPYPELLKRMRSARRP